MDARRLKAFRFERVLNEDPALRLVVLLGWLPVGPSVGDMNSSDVVSTGSSPAIITIQKSHFSSGETLHTLLQRIEKVEVLEQNDIYSEVNAWQSRGDLIDSDYKISVISNATPLHIANKTRQKATLIKETPQVYQQVVLPYIRSIPAERTRWVQNILDHHKEADKILFEDPSPDQGFIILPDFKWDLTTINALYLVAIVKSSQLKSLRDLRKCHLPMLLSINKQAGLIVSQRWGLPANSLRMFLHYQPSYYHLHVHIVSLEMESFQGMNVGHAHLLDDIVSLLETEEEGIFERMTLTYVLSELHPLTSRLKQSTNQTEAENESVEVVQKDQERISTNSKQNSTPYRMEDCKCKKPEM